MILIVVALFVFKHCPHRNNFIKHVYFCDKLLSMVHKAIHKLILAFFHPPGRIPFCFLQTTSLLRKSEQSLLSRQMGRADSGSVSVGSLGPIPSCWTQSAQGPHLPQPSSTAAPRSAGFFPRFMLWSITLHRLPTPGFHLPFTLCHFSQEAFPDSLQPWAGSPALARAWEPRRRHPAFLSPARRLLGRSGPHPGYRLPPRAVANGAQGTSACHCPSAEGTVDMGLAGE